MVSIFVGVDCGGWNLDLKLRVGFMTKRNIVFQFVNIWVENERGMYMAGY